MKWPDLTLKERKQIYDAVRAENPNASYFDIKSQFDSIPEYEDGIMLTNTDKGYVDWKSKLASNLKNETYGYDLYGAYKSGAQQQLEDDGYYHLPTRDPKTNKILKYPSHNTFWLGITEDIKQGYYPQVKDGRTYTVPVYEDGKNRSRWLSDKAYRDSISTLQNSQRFKISKEFKSPTLEELRDDSSVGGNIGNSDGLFTVLDGLEALKTTPSITSEQIENATDSQYNSRINRLEPLKQYAKVGSIIGQVALGGGAIVARNAGNAALSSVLQGAGALWDGVEAIQAVNDGDFKSVIQNVVPIGAAGVASLKYAPKFKYTNNLVIDAAENIGPIWDFSVNPIIESTKDGKAPAYEDGGKKIVPPRELGLTPGTPEYYKRQQQISGRAELVQPEAYVTPVGYIKDAITTAEELEKGNYGNAAVSTLMNVIPWGVGKGLRKIKSRVSNTLNTPIEIHSSMVDEYPSILAEKARRKTSKNKKKVKEESDYDSEFSEVIRRDRNIKKYEKEINKTIEDAILPDKKTYELVKGIDTAYGTDYLDAYKRIAARDMTGRGKYIKYAELPGNKNAKISRVRDVQDYGPVVDDYVITIDPLQYLPGTANHELGHLADQLASDANNRYLTYLLDEGNIMGPGELRSKGINVGSDMQSYLLDPSESKSHMLHLKRALVNEGKIHDWSSKVNQNTIEDFLFDPRNTGVVNNANKLQYNMYRNKSRFVDRINNLTPMEFITPLLLPVAGYETNKE